MSGFRLISTVGAFCLAATCTASAVSAQASVEPLEDCFFAAPETTPPVAQECGYVVLPENPDRPDGPEIKLGFLRLPAKAENPKAPLFMLAGGPGDSFIKPPTHLLFGDAFLGPILDERDVVLLDQRGTRNAIPTLDCPSAYSLPWEAKERGLDEAEMLELSWQVLADCVADTRAAGVDLAQYNSVRIAADLDAARQALGYGRIVYYGASYGAQLGQHYMRDFPDSLEAVILDGANSLSRKSWVQERVRDVDVATRKLAALCAADAKCGAAYNVTEMVDRAMALFDEGPIETTYQDPADPETQLAITLTEADLAETIFGFQTGQIGIHALPAVLDTMLADGRASAAALLGDQKGAAIVASRGATEGGSAILMHMAVVCSDDPVTSADDMIIEPDASAYARAYGAAVLEEYVEFCRAVDVPSLPDDTDVDVTTDVPTLILAGDLDARTPVIRSELVAETLPRATIVEFPQGTHVQLGEINQCAGKILRAFLDDPDATPDTGCIADMPRRGFVLPDGTISVQ
ncbi:pimeloyl-ACP methyl ester carboxylesterase [Rhodovulum iodosum]|uniref:Pimeloyl-ACP methyl ester carboxylesterase n=1 Tax=Rhodovulum iodosum TaxID=68291 RepID=A0ABV3XTQ4_9RHOB|nr:alpha/beta fold hydrolase [Rhodovulum robiginosum]RSK32146.1 alpha/beta fold hydrolase [Rhodovulum robiginosum]